MVRRLAAFGGGALALVADPDDLLLDAQGASLEVDVLALQAEDLAAAQMCPVGQQDQDPEVAALRLEFRVRLRRRARRRVYCVGQVADLLVVQQRPFGGDGLAGAGDAARVGGDQLGLHSGVQDPPQQSVGGADATGAAGLVLLGEPLDRPACQRRTSAGVIPAGHPAELRDQVQPEQLAVQLSGAGGDRAELEPVPGVVLEADAPCGRVLPAAVLDRGLHLGQVQRRVRLGRERAARGWALDAVGAVVAGLPAAVGNLADGAEVAAAGHGQTGGVLIPGTTC